MAQEQRAKNQEASITKINTNLPSADLFEADAQKGTENITQDDLALPFLKVLGQLSPEVNKRDAKYVKGAEPGMVLNTVTAELYDGDKGINVIPCFYKREYVEWQVRGESSGKPVAVHAPDSDILKTVTRDKSYKDRLPNGNYLENTASFFVIVHSKVPCTAIVTMKSTQLKISRKWNSMIMGMKLQGKKGLFTPPSYSHLYNLRTVQQSNDKGTWFGWDVQKIGPVSDRALYEQAKHFADSCNKGMIRAKHGKENSSNGGTSNF